MTTPNPPTDPPAPPAPPADPPAPPVNPPKDPAPPSDPPKDPPADPPKVDPPKDPVDIDALIARNKALEEALTKTSGDASSALEEVGKLRAEAINARRDAALSKMGLAPQFHALAPEGDPKDPKVAEAMERFAADPKFARLFGSRTTDNVDVDHEALDAVIKDAPGEGVFTSAKHRRAGWSNIRKGG